MVAQRVAPGSTIYADEAACWDVPHAKILANMPTSYILGFDYRMARK